MRFEDILPAPFEWIEIPSGKVILGNSALNDNETSGVFDTSTFAIAKYPITNAQYKVFVDAENGYAESSWWGYSDAAIAWRGANLHSTETGFSGDDYPRTNVSWYEAVAFCRWLTAQLQPSPLAPLPQGEGNEHYRQMASQAMVEIARDLRQRQTYSEDILWDCLRDRRLAGLKFRRQHPVAGTNYVVDFFNYEQRLVIELDGSIHNTQQAADAARQSEIESLGYQVLRFRNEQIFNNLESILISILQVVKTPLREGEGNYAADRTTVAARGCRRYWLGVFVGE